MLASTPRCSECVFSLPSEPSRVTALIEPHLEVPGRDRVFRFEDGVFRFEVFYRDSRTDNISALPAPVQISMPIGNETQLLLPSRQIACPSGSNHKLMEKEHGPDKDLDLLIATYRSMKANVSSSNTDFIAPDNNAIYKQNTPLGNTILHLAATYGKDAMVGQVAEYAPHLFTATNNNFDTALHVAARAGHSSTIRFLLNTFWLFVKHETNGHANQSILEMVLMVSLTLLRNNQGNTFFHEAFMANSNNGAEIFQDFEASVITDSPEFETDFKRIVSHLAPFAINKEGKSLLYLTIEVGCCRVVNRLLDICDQYQLQPEGKSPLLPAIINRDIDMLKIILCKKPNWIHLKNEEGRFPLHHAASMGYLEGVSYLINKCPSCTMEIDNDGFFPIHLACSGGHVEVVHELLKWCPDPTEMLDNMAQNFLHIAVVSGKYEVVRYILQHPELEKMINQKDNNGNTPLHLATLHWRPKIVYALTWHNKVNLGLLNQQNQTALDIADQTHHQQTSLAQRLTWSALQSAGTPRSSVRFHPHKETMAQFHNTESYKDRIDTLIVVSTLIITASFAAGFAMPGDIDKGMAVMLNHRVFHLFILSLTVSIFGAITTTIILIWARLGDLRLTLFALKCAMPLLGISLSTLALAFLAAVYLVINKHSWLAISILVLGVVLILVVIFLYTLLWLPSSSSSPFIRYISYYPFLGLAMLAEGDIDPSYKGLTKPYGFIQLQSRHGHTIMY